jgi:uncharacterized protein (DUF2141 family)
MIGILEDLKTVIYSLLFFVVLYWLSSCANPMTPTGGPRDEIAPQVLEALPRNKSVNVTPQLVHLRFNEYIVLDNPSQNISISPPIEGTPDFVVKGKTLQIKFPKTRLQENTTYTINFGAAIKDNNEGNIQDSFTYVFSTGPFLDSLSFTGNVNNALTAAAEEGFVVGLYKDTINDSIVFTKKPDYYTKTKKDGSFKLENLKEGKYKLFTFKDENFSFTRDLPNENYAFHIDLVAPAENPIPTFLRTFEERKPISVSDINPKNTGVIQFVMSEPVYSFMISGFDKTIGLQDTAYVFNEKKDTVLLYYTFSINKIDSFIVQVNNNAIDTFSQTFKNNNIDSVKAQLPPLGLFTALQTSTKKGLGGVQKQGTIQQDYEEDFIMKMNRPIKNILVERIKLLEDTVQNEIPFSVKIDNKTNVLFHVEQPEKTKEGEEYEIQIGDSAFVDFYGLYNGAFSIKYKTTKKEEYGESIITIDSIESGKQYVMQLISPTDKIVAEEYIKDTQTITYKYKKLTPGSYKLKLIEDNNGNKKWDTGNYLTGEQPEKILVFPEKIDVRANWENEVVFKLNTMKPKKKMLEEEDVIKEKE